MPVQQRSGLDALYSAKQQAVLRTAMTTDYRMIINHGAKRSGKTVVDNDIFLYDVRRQGINARRMGVRLPQYILCASDLSSLRRNVLNDIADKYGLEFKFDKANRFMLFGVLVCCFGHSKINDLGRIRGMTSWGAYINEATVANQSVFDEILSRCSAPGARIIMDTNPDNPSHWLKKDYIDPADQKRVLTFHWKLTDNPFLPQEYIADQMAQTPTGMFYERAINGRWVAAEGAVYPDFDRAVHFVKAAYVPPIVRYWAGMDFGWEHFGAFVLMGEADNGDYYLLKEWSAQHRSIDAWIRIINDVEQKTGPLVVYCDSARPDLIDNVLAAGIDARNAHKDVVAGIGECATMFKQKRLFVVEENTERFEQEIDQYAWKPGLDEPIKVNDDVMDAMRYAVYSDRVEHEQACWLNAGGDVMRRY